MALPLMLGSEPLGAVGVTLAGSEQFGSGNQRFHEAVTQQLAQALQRVALLKSTGRRLTGCSSWPRPVGCSRRA